MDTSSFFCFPTRRLPVCLRLLATMCFLFLSLTIGAQGCPELKAEDFTAIVVAGNSDCGTTGHISVAYRNSVVGFEKMVYEISKDNATFSGSVETSSFTAPTLVPLTGLAVGDHVYLRVTAHCSGTTEQLVLTLPDYSEKPSAAVKPNIVTTPAGGCSATSGSLSVSVGTVSGFSKAEYRLYRGSSLIATETSTTPDEAVTFFNLPSGELRLVMRATPQCVPATPGSGWNHGAYEITQTVRVPYFTILPTPIPTRGTCPGGVILRAARLMGVSALKYEVFPLGGIAAATPPVASKDLTYPQFSHTFLNLPLGHYEVRATADCGVAEIVPFEITTGTSGTLKANVVQQTYASCTVGKIHATVPNTTVACPVDYTLIPGGGGTPIVKNGITTSDVVFEGLTAGNYTLKATWAGQTQSVPLSITTVTPGTLKLSSTPAETVCDPTGSIKVELQGGTLYENATLEFWLDGAAVRSVSIDATEKERTIIGLNPGAYDVKLRTACGAEIAGQVTVDYNKKVFATPNFYGENGIYARENYCTGQKKVFYSFSPQWFNPEADEGSKAFYRNATYEVYNKQGVLVGSGAFPEKKDNTYSFLSSEIGIVTIKIYAACGSPVISSTFMLKNNSGSETFSASVVEATTPCVAKGKIQMSVSGYGSYFIYTLRRSSDLSLVAQSHTPVSSYTVENLAADTYVAEAYPVCNPQFKMTKVVNLQAAAESLKPTITGSGNGYPNGKLSVNLNTVPTEGSTQLTQNFILKNSLGVEVARKTVTGSSYSNIEFEHLAPGNYSLVVHTTGGSCSIPDVTFPYTIPLQAKPQLPGYIYPWNETPPDLCGNNGKAQYAWTGSENVTSKSVTWSVLDINTGTVLDTKTGEFPTDVVSFEHLPSRFILKLTTEKGDFYQEMNIAKKTFTEEEAKKYMTITGQGGFPGCQNASLTVKSHLKDFGISQQPSKILVKSSRFDMMSGRSEPAEIIDSVASTTLIDEYTFENLPSGQYYVYYSVCGSSFYQETSVTTASQAPQIQANFQWNAGPCKEHLVVYVSSMEGDRVKYTVYDKFTGVKLFERESTGGKNETFDTGVGEYNIEAEVEGKCGSWKLTGTCKVPKSSLDINAFYRSTMQCATNGSVELKVQNPGALTKVRYTLEKESGVPDVAESTDFSKSVKFIGLIPGTYKVKAVGSCINPSGTYTEYEWETSFTLTSNYTSLQAVPKPDYNVPSMECNATGSVGLDISGGSQYDTQVFVTHDSNGPVVPEREIKKVGYYGSWGGNLAPGTYSVRVTDGCMSVNVNNLTVDKLEDIITSAETTGSYTVLDYCRGYSTVLKVKVKNPLSNSNILENYAYQIAAVPHGDTPTEELWTDLKSYSVYGEIAQLNWNFPSRFEVSRGVDIYIRIKGCPSSTRTFFSPLGTRNPLPFSINQGYVDCDHNRFYLNRVDLCWPVDLIITRLSDNHVVLKRENVLYFDRADDYRYDPDFTVPGTDSYRFEVRDHADQSVLAQRTIPANPVYPSTIAISVNLYNHSCTDCSCTVGASTGSCEPTPLGKFILYDATGTTKLYESAASVNSWVIPTRLANGTEYLLDFVDNAGVSQLSARKQIKVDFDIPTSYGYDNYELGDHCNDNNTTTLPQGMNLHYPSGSSKTKVIPTISKIELLNTTTGRVYTPLSLSSASNNYVPWKVIETTSIPPYSNNERDIDFPPGDYTLTVVDACGTHTSNFKINYKSTARIDLSATTVTVGCDGKFAVVPTGSASFPDRPDPVSIVSYTIKGETIQPGDTYKTFDKGIRIAANLKFTDGSTCTRYWDLDLSRYALGFDNSQSASFFCEGSGKGQIMIGLKGGRPPYTYVLKKADGTVVETKANVNGATYFEHGKLGETYRIEATDACALATIYQDVKLQDPKEIGYAMDRTLYFCEGEEATFEALRLPGATYTWTYPNGTISHNREVKVTTSAATGGKYKVKILPGTCTTTINATIDVHVARVKESWKKVEVQVCAGQNAHVVIDAPTVTDNGTPVTAQQYQWQMATDTTGSGNWQPIVGATGEDLTYAPPYSGTVYVRRVTVQGNCQAKSYASKIVADPGLNSSISPDELHVVIDHKNPFTLTAGFVTGSPTRTYQWQRSTDKVHWTNVGTGATFTETTQYASRQYYRRITTAGSCTTVTPVITVRFKKRYPALINPQLRQRAQGG